MEIIKKIVIILFLIFNIFGTITYYKESVGNQEIISEEVIITDKYRIGHGGRYSYYMTGKNENGFYKIPTDSYDIGDKVIIYQNPNSANAKGGDPQWHTTVKAVQGESYMRLIMFIIFTIINIIVLYHFFFHPKSKNYDDIPKPDLSICLEKALVNGKMRFKPGLGELLSLIFCWGLLIGLIYLLIDCLKDGDYNIFPALLAIPALIYTIPILPLMQNPNNFEATFSDGTFNSFKFYYKGKEVLIDHGCADDGRYTYIYDDPIYHNLRYADGSSMNRFSRDRVHNYLVAWLKYNLLFSTQKKS